MTLKPNIIDKEFFQNLNTTEMGNELQDTITALREKVIKQEEDIKELLDGLLTIQKRIEDCSDDPITVKEMYDSFYREVLEDLITKHKI